MALQLVTPSPLRYAHRPVLVDLAVLEHMVLRDEFGHLLRLDMGQPDESGMFSPTITQVDDGHRVVSVAALNALEYRAGGLP